MSANESSQWWSEVLNLGAKGIGVKVISLQLVQQLVPSNIKENIKHRISVPHMSPVDSPHIGPVLNKTLPCHGFNILWDRIDSILSCNILLDHCWCSGQIYISLTASTLLIRLRPRLALKNGIQWGTSVLLLVTWLHCNITLCHF